MAIPGFWVVTVSMCHKRRSDTMMQHSWAALEPQGSICHTERIYQYLFQFSCVKDDCRYPVLGPIGVTPFNQPRPVLPQATPLKLGRTQDKAGHWRGLPIVQSQDCRHLTAKYSTRADSNQGRPIISSFSEPICKEPKWVQVKLRSMEGR